MRQYSRQHDVIRGWAEERGGRPARVRGSEVLRLAFEKLPPNWETISWQEFFRTFDRSGQTFMYEDSPGSRICKLTRGSQAGPIRPTS
jgi:hypothetical protein